MDDKKGGGYKWVVLGMLTMVYAFNFIDRQLIVILAEPIKAELNLTDIDLGWLTGFAFAAFYVLLGIPIARYADKNNRKNVIVVSLALWSAMTAISGKAGNFLQLFLARIGVGVGEAGGSPPAHSIISDYFPPRKRATALSIYSTGIYFGILIGYIGGGAIALSYGWRMAFYAIGIPGVIFSVILYFVVKEPVKGQNDISGEVKEAPKLKETISLLLTKRTFLFVALGAGFNAFGTYGIGNFLPSFLDRVHGVDLKTISIVLGLSTGIGGMLGTYLGGIIADRKSSQDKRWYTWVPMLAALISLIPLALLIFTEVPKTAMIMTFLTSFFTAFYMGPCLAVCHSLVNASMRSFTSAIFFFVLNFIGLGLGPLVVGMLSDYFTPEFGDLSLRYAFLIVLATGLISSILFYLASKSYRSELKSYESQLV